VLRFALKNFTVSGIIEGINYNAVYELINSTNNYGSARSGMGRHGMDCSGPR
jgi:hypothetical protein